MPLRVRPFARLPRPWRWAARVLTGLLVLALVAAGVVVWQVRASFPQTGGTLQVAGLRGGVEVRRDGFGVPHVYADTSADLFLAQGYVDAQDRFWEMDFRRHVTAGRLSEVFGASTLEQDRVIRTLGWRRVAEQELGLLEPATRDHLDAYARGVNAWLQAHPGRAERSLEYAVLGLTNPGYRPEPWTAVDSLAWLKAMAWDLRSNLGDEFDRAAAATTLPRERVEQLYPPYPFDRHEPILSAGGAGVAGSDQDAAGTAPAPAGADVPAALRRAERAVDALPDLVGEAGSGLGSNSWVISGRFTATGRPLLANDPHLGAAMPSVWRQVGLHCRTAGPQCPFDVTGFSFAGLPGVVIGHNAHIAWGFTNLGQDVTDLFLERVTGSTYLTADGPRPLRTRTERIEVAGGEPVELTVAETDNGPLITDVLADAADALAGGQGVGPDGAATAVALRWTALDPGRTADSIFALNSATDWASFRAAAARFQVPGQNIVYADTAGNIGYQATGAVPVRAAGDGRWPVPGWTGQYAWTGTVPFEQLPSAVNPEQGYLVTANNAVVDPAEVPLRLSEDWSRGYRSQRILQRVREAIAAGPVDVQTMESVQADTANGAAAFLVPALRAVPVEGPARRAVALFDGWDGDQGPDSAPAAYLNAVWRHLLLATFDDDLAPGARPGGGDRWFDVVRTLLASPDDPFWDDVTSPAVERRDDVLRTALTAAADELTDRLGADPAAWRWGDLHELTLTHGSLGASGIAPVEWLFNRGPVEVGGSRDAVVATGWNVRDGYAVTTVPSMRMVVDLADPDRSRWVNLTGSSGHAFHRHYWDQTELWARGASTPMVSGPEAVRAATADVLGLRPQ
ncbi:MAG TPA: penicillin acylase family protein [Pseudonocardia sp.]|nr:penicillin acylase family protein [Pseudonocardia sp.]